MAQFIFAWPSPARDAVDTPTFWASVSTGIWTQQNNTKATPFVAATVVVVSGAAVPLKLTTLRIQKLWGRDLCQCHQGKVKVK